ncbi:PIR Superfamily Protein [Plasmodium ovale curtisi]|uniref:PIR Superfamily Protein n=1 Tax=Plasmodium ovale curtisi TaxID=864141 RepID=A0A1A8WPQ5_PLAOA|nr:PIR Superfamily Protein [Plasmodium ovale curtisi]
MPENIVDKALKLLEKDGITQKNSRLQKFYDNFSSAIKDTYVKYEKCVKENEKPEPSNRKVICNIANANDTSFVALSEEFKSVHEQESRSCDYLLYWMSDKIEECKYNTHCIIWLYNMFSEFWKKCNCCEKKHDSNDDNCKETFVIEFDKNVLKNKKELYEFMENYNYIKNSISEQNSERNETYCKYVKYMFELYHLIFKKDNEHVHKKYVKELKNVQTIFNDEDLLSKLRSDCKYADLYGTSQREEEKSKSSPQDYAERSMPNEEDLSTLIENALEEMKDILKDEPSYELYKEFDKDITDNETDEHCNEHFKEESTYKNKSIEICTKIVNNFKKLYDFKSTIKSSERCLYYKNWVYSTIQKMIITNSYNNVWNIIDRFMSLQNKNIKVNGETKKFCHYYFIFNDIIELNIKLEEKYLHDYFRYYSTLENKIVHDKDNKEKFRNYLTNISKLYERHKIGWNCCDVSYGVDPLCRHYFKCEEEYSPSDLLKILNGAKKEDIKKTYKSPPIVLFGEQKLTGGLKEEDVMRIQYGRCTKIYYPDDREKVFGLRCDYKARLPHYNNFVSALTDEKKKDSKESTEGTIIQSSSTNDPVIMSNTEEIESNPTNYKIPTSVALGIGTVFTFFLYYRFTPFGSLFGKRGRRRISFEDYSNEEHMQHFSHDSEYEEVNPRSRRIQIAYQQT